MTDVPTEFSALEYATEITVAWLSNPNTRATAEDVPAFLISMHGAVQQLNSSGSAQEEGEPAQEYTPAVTVRKSLASSDHIISLVDGKPYKSLKRHLSSHGLTPTQYRERYGLKADYPMVAPAYAETRRQLAKKIGLGRKPGQKIGQKAPKAETIVPAEPTAPAMPAAPVKKSRAVPKTAAAPAKADRSTKVTAQTKAGAAPAKKTRALANAAASSKAEAPTKSGAPIIAAAPAKPTRRKKLGLQFGDSGAVSADQS